MLYEVITHSGQSAAAWQQLQRQLEADKYECEAVYFAKLRAWDKPQLAINAGQEYIRRLTERDERKSRASAVTASFKSSTTHWLAGGPTDSSYNFV